MKTKTFAVSHLEFISRRPFADVVTRFEQQLGQFDSNIYPALDAPDSDPAAIRSAIERMAGPSGMMLFGRQNHGNLLSVLGMRRKAIQFEVGNPLIAIEMTRHDLGAGLYAPLRILISEDSRGQTVIEYDQPSSLFGRFNDERISTVGRRLDAKLEELARTSAEWVSTDA